MPDKAADFQCEWIRLHGASLEKKFEGFKEKPSDHRLLPKRLKKVAFKQKHRFSEESVDEELDLHGMTIEQGLGETETFLDLARHYKLSAIRVIHGLGPDSGPSLRSEVLRYLKTKAKGKIQGFKIEPHNQGAVIIYPKL
jgi:DNA-nicking Smr family endonuclease